MRQAVAGRVLRALCAVGLVVGVVWAGVAGAVTLTGTRPWAAEHVVLSSTTDWVLYSAPSWARQCLIRNEHASGTLYLGRYDETGTFSSANDEYVTIPAGAAVTLPLTAGSSSGPADHLVIPLASSTASLPVGWFCTESSQ